MTQLHFELKTPSFFLFFFKFNLSRLSFLSFNLHGFLVPCVYLKKKCFNKKKINKTTWVLFQYNLETRRFWCQFPQNTLFCYITFFQYKCFVFGSSCVLPKSSLSKALLPLLALRFPRLLTDLSSLLYQGSPSFFFRFAVMTMVYARAWVCEIPFPDVELIPFKNPFKTWTWVWFFVC